MERCQIVERWPYVMGELGAERKKHWWTELWERDVVHGEGKEKEVMEET